MKTNPSHFLSKYEQLKIQILKKFNLFQFKKKSNQLNSMKNNYEKLTHIMKKYNINLNRPLVLDTIASKTFNIDLLSSNFISLQCDFETNINLTKQILLAYFLGYSNLVITNSNTIDLSINIKRTRKLIEQFFPKIVLTEIKKIMENIYFDIINRHT